MIFTWLAPSLEQAQLGVGHVGVEFAGRQKTMTSKTSIYPVGGRKGSEGSLEGRKPESCLQAKAGDLAKVESPGRQIANRMLSAAIAMTSPENY